MKILLDTHTFIMICHPWQLGSGQPSLRSPCRDDGYRVYGGKGMAMLMVGVVLMGTRCFAHPVF